MIPFLRKIIPERSALRLLYHKISAILAALAYRFPSHRLKIIAVTGTSGKSTTVELVHYLLQHSGKKAGALSTINFHFGKQVEPNTTLRTSLRPWTTQRLLRRMVREGLEYCVLEVSSHAIDQNRLWGVSVDMALLTNVRDQEHLDYHGTFAEYLRVKLQLFKSLNLHFRKSGTPKSAILNADDPHFEIFDTVAVDRKWTYSREKNADVRASDITLMAQKTAFTLHIPNHKLHLSVPLIGRHNLENLLAAMAVALFFRCSVERVKKSLVTFEGVPGRLEVVTQKEPFSVVVDFSYKPSALEAVLKTLRDIVKKRIIVVWGGAGGRSRKNRQASAEILHQGADEIVLTTDDPLAEDPKAIAAEIRKKIPRKEGDRFFEIEDRYEAIRYAIFIADPGDLVLIAGRGHETVQTIGDQIIPFDDRVVAREILRHLEQRTTNNEQRAENNE